MLGSNSLTPTPPDHSNLVTTGSPAYVAFAA